MILWRVDSPRNMLNVCHCEPPVQGIAPNNNVGMLWSLTASIAAVNPASLVKSFLAVSRMTSQLGGAERPMIESSPQQYSTILRLVFGLYVLTVGRVCAFEFSDVALIVCDVPNVLVLMFPARWSKSTTELVERYSKPTTELVMFELLSGLINCSTVTMSRGLSGSAAC